VAHPEAPGDPGPGDPYAQLQYRRLIAWPERIRREAPFLEAVAGDGPERTLLDLGCGTGEHARHFAERGYRVLGIDRSATQLAAAAEPPLPPGLSFATGDLTSFETTGAERFGTALCLGNTLVHLLERSDLVAACKGVFSALLPGGAWLAQILNYERIFARRERSLPVNVLERDGEELVFLRLMRLLPGGRVIFVPSTLRLQPERDPPVAMVSSHAVTLRGWSRLDLEPALRSAGFTSVIWYGDMLGAPFLVEESSDLVFVARRS